MLFPLLLTIGALAQLVALETKNPRPEARVAGIGWDITVAALTRRTAGDARTLITHEHHLLYA
jgi:hypothetical protein